MITLLICSVTMSALALFYIAITPLLAKRYSVVGRYYTWLVIVIGLIIPFRPQFSNAIIKVDMPSNTVIPTTIPLENKIPATFAVKHTLSSTVSNISWWQIAAMIWLIGMILFLTYHAIKHYHFLKLVARWSKNITDKQILTLTQNLKAQMDLPQNIDLQFCDSIGSPMIIGFVNPRILLPKLDFAKDELYFILKHELVHYKRKDLWYKYLVLIATAIHWFNPIVYLIAKSIDIQCELSCDEEVVRNADADTRQYYSETIISVVRHQSKRKTALSTNFYGGKKNMKERIFSIMDMSNKKSSLVILCGVLILTCGTGFAAKAKTQSPHQIMKEDIMLSPNSSYAYKFLPDPEIYAKYSTYGITISDNREMLFYNGQKVRLFVDEYSDVEAFFLDETGTIDLTVIRNVTGNIIGIENLSEEKAQQYRSSFFADGLNTVNKTQNITAQNKYEYDTSLAYDNTQDIIGQNKYDQYSAYGITLSEDGNILYYNGQRVKLLVDKLSGDSFKTFWVDEAGIVNLSVIRGLTGQITTIESISEEKAQQYHSAASEYEENILNGLDEKIENRIKALYLENELVQ